MPTDSADYSNAQGSASINIGKATTEVTWPNPADIVYGTARLDHAARRDRVCSGHIHLHAGAGTILGAGDGQTLAVSFTPNDSVDFAGADGLAMLNFDRAALTITWANPAAIVYGTALSATQLDASASVPGRLLRVLRVRSITRAFSQHRSRSRSCRAPRRLP